MISHDQVIAGILPAAKVSRFPRTCSFCLGWEVRWHVGETVVFFAATYRDS